MAKHDEQTGTSLALALGAPLAAGSLEAALHVARAHHMRHPGDEDAKRVMEALELLMAQVWFGGAEEGEEPDPRYALAAQYLEAVDLAGALARYEEIIAQDPGSPRPKSLALRVRVVIAASAGKPLPAREDGALVAAAAVGPAPLFQETTRIADEGELPLSAFETDESTMSLSAVIPPEAYPDEPTRNLMPGDYELLGAEKAAESTRMLRDEEAANLIEGAKRPAPPPPLPVPKKKAPPPPVGKEVTRIANDEELPLDEVRRQVEGDRADEDLDALMDEMDSGEAAPPEVEVEEASVQLDVTSMRAKKPAPKPQQPLANVERSSILDPSEALRRLRGEEPPKVVIKSAPEPVAEPSLMLDIEVEKSLVLDPKKALREMQDAQREEEARAQAAADEAAQAGEEMPEPEPPAAAPEPSLMLDIEVEKSVMLDPKKAIASMREAEAQEEARAQAAADQAALDGEEMPEPAPPRAAPEPSLMLDIEIEKSIVLDSKKAIAALEQAATPPPEASLILDVTVDELERQLKMAALPEEILTPPPMDEDAPPRPSEPSGVRGPVVPRPPPMGERREPSASIVIEEEANGYEDTMAPMPGMRSPFADPPSGQAKLDRPIIEGAQEPEDRMEEAAAIDAALRRGEEDESLSHDVELDSGTFGEPRAKREDSGAFEERPPEEEADLWASAAAEAEKVIESRPPRPMSAPPPPLVSSNVAPPVLDAIPGPPRVPSAPPPMVTPNIAPPANVPSMLASDQIKSSEMSALAPPIGAPPEPPRMPPPPVAQTSLTSEEIHAPLEAGDVALPRQSFWEVPDPGGAEAPADESPEQAAFSESSWSGVRVLEAEPATFDAPSAESVDGDTWEESTIVGITLQEKNAEALVARGELGEALRLYQDLAAQHPDEPRLWDRIAQIARMLQDRSGR